MPATPSSQSTLRQETRTGHAPPLRRRTQEQIRPVGTGLAGPRRTRGAPPDRHLRRPGRTAPQPPHRSAPTSTPSTTTATSTGSRPWPWSASTRRPGSPAGATSASSGWTRTGSGSSTTTGSRWCPRPRRKSGRPTWPRTQAHPLAPRRGRPEQLLKFQTGADQPRESPGRTDNPRESIDRIFELSLPLPVTKGRTKGEKRGESDATQLRSSRTSGNSEPLSHVDDDGTDSPSRLPGHRASGGIRGGPTAEGPQAGTAKTVSLSADRLPAETARPPVSGELVTFERCVRAESRPASRPGKTPGPGRQRRPPGRAGAFGPVHRGLEHGRDRLRRPEQCPASDEPELEYRVEALTGPAPRHQFHPDLPLAICGSPGPGIC